MNIKNNNNISRRQILQSGLGFGAAALAGLLAHDGKLAASEPEAILNRLPQIAPKAKRVIYLFMSGGPSQIDTFDPKPLLSKLHGSGVPESIAKNVPRLSRGSGLQHLMASPFSFKQYGQSGIPVSSLFPHLAQQVDDLCVIRSMHHRIPIHGPGEILMLTGTALGVRPSLGAWLTYGLGSENDDMPWFVVMNAKVDRMQFPQPPGWDAAFLPARYQGTVVNANTGIRNISLPKNYTNESRREQLEFLANLNSKHSNTLGNPSELEARIRSYELAFRMQAVAPTLFDLSQESDSTHKMYGTGDKKTELMGKHCLLARRLVESGVRFVQLRYGGWDAHNKLKQNHEEQSLACDKPIAAMLLDLKQRGLLDDTLVIWGGEFGRTPTMETRAKGRDHSPTAFTYWLAGGGVKGGQIIGKTDEVGYTPIERPVRPSDLHATMLHSLGIDQNELYYYHHGRKEIVTVLGGEIVQEVFGS